MVKRSSSQLHSPGLGALNEGWSVLETKCNSDGESGTVQKPSEAPSASTDSAPNTDDAPRNVTPASMLDVALSLMLTEIAHQARSITAATGAAVLLMRDGVPVHTSSSGATAQEASAYLSKCLGLADLSGREGASHCCHDVEGDPRFDLASCRQLGIRSFVIVPVRDKEKSLVAIVQTFSPRPQAFSERDLLALEGLGQRVTDHIEVAERSLVSKAKTKEKIYAEIALENETLFRFTQRLNSHERRSIVLGLLIIGLSILLGWTMGRSERKSARLNSGTSTGPVMNSPQITVTREEPNTEVQGGDQSARPAVAMVGSAEIKGAEINGAELNSEAERSQLKSESRTHHVKSRPSGLSKLIPPDSSSNDLVIYENGQQVFPKKSAQSQHVSEVPAKSEEQTKLESKDDKTPVSVSKDVAEEHLLNRVEPDYPEYAREQRLQGTVILNINVGKDGDVHSLSRVSGDPQLSLLAAKAVRQWKFAPLVRDGAPVSFETQVSLNFALP